MKAGGFKAAKEKTSTTTGERMAAATKKGQADQYTLVIRWIGGD
jgi:hypothetical protein